MASYVHTPQTQLNGYRKKLMAFCDILQHNFYLNEDLRLNLVALQTEKLLFRFLGVYAKSQILNN